MSNSESRRLPAAVFVRLTGSERQAIDAAAQLAGISTAAFMRRQVLSTVGTREITVARRSPVQVGTDLDAIARLAGGVNRAAGAAIQLAKILRTAPVAGRYHSEIEDVLVDLRARAGDLDVIVGQLR